MKKLIYIISFALATTIFSSCEPESQIDDKYIGYWYDGEGKWAYGLFEDFVIYKKDIWNYKSVETVSDSCLNVQITKGNRTEKLKLKLKVNIFDDGYNFKTLKVNDESYFGSRTIFARRDSIPLNDFTTGNDTATVICYCRNTLKGVYAMVRYFYLTSNDSIAKINVEDLAGNRDIDNVVFHETNTGICFTARFPVANIARIHTNYISSKRHEYNRIVVTENSDINNYIINSIVVEPNDTLVISFDEDNFELENIDLHYHRRHFMGKNGLLNESIERVYYGKYNGKYYNFNNCNSISDSSKNDIKSPEFDMQNFEFDMAVSDSIKFQIDTLKLPARITEKHYDYIISAKTIYRMNEILCSFIDNSNCSGYYINNDILTYVHNVLNERNVKLFGNATMAKYLFENIENGKCEVKLPEQYADKSMRLERIKNIDNLGLPQPWDEVYLAKDCYYAILSSGKPLEQWQLDIFHEKVKTPYFVKFIDQFNQWTAKHGSNE